MTFNAPFSRTVAPPFGPLTSGSRTIVYDTFTAADGTDLYGHFPDVNAGSAWTGYLPGYSGGFLINSNTAVGRSPFTGSDRYQWIETGAPDCHIRATYTGDIAGSVYPKMYARIASTPSNNCWLFNAKPAANEIYELTAGVFTLRASVVNNKSSPGTYTLEIILSGSSISFTCNGATISYSSAQHATNTLHGISFNSATASMAFDNFTVTVP